MHSVLVTPMCLQPHIHAHMPVTILPTRPSHPLRHSNSLCQQPLPPPLQHAPIKSVTAERSYETSPHIHEPRKRKATVQWTTQRGLGKAHSRLDQRTNIRILRLFLVTSLFLRLVRTRVSRWPALQSRSDSEHQFFRAMSLTVEHQVVKSERKAELGEVHSGKRRAMRRSGRTSTQRHGIIRGTSFMAMWSSTRTYGA